MPEFVDGCAFDNKQLLYNAIVCSASPPNAVESASWGRLKSLYR
jgi:hypothetical protein